MKTWQILFSLSLALIFAAPSRAGDFEELSPGNGRFMLLDRSDVSRILDEQEISTAAATEGLDRMSEEPSFQYNGDAWNKAREDLESGRLGQEELPPPVEVAVSTETPAPPQPQVEFPESGTSLSVTGRKVISLNYSGKRYIYEQTTITRPRSLSLFEITQQMQVRMQGKVGQKINVNVDYDDTKQDKQDISVVYQGDPNEVVQNVSFGDIDLSLPSTEFVSYNKQLFGIRADLKTNRLKMTLVGSRTKGTTKTKEFTGDTQFQGVDIMDTDYLRRKYYDVTFGNTYRLPIKSGSERIYIDQQTQAQVDNVTVFGLAGKDMNVQTSTYTGRFKLMNPGVDYVMDYTKGLVTFNRTLNPQDVVIVDYTNSNGTRLSQNGSTTSITADALPSQVMPAIIKTENDIALSSDPVTAAELVSDKRELKTYYSIGQSNIVRDNGNGNFTLKVEDLNHNFVGSSLNPPEIYPDNIEVDFDQGIIHLLKPFSDPNAPLQPDPQIYAATPISKRLIRVEYYYRFKTFMLEPNIVLQSETVTVDGKKLGRNNDYFIDYDSGFITFYYPDQIGQNSKITITYEVSPFGGAGNQSLVGGRASYDLGSHFSVGSTLLYQGGIKSNTVPNITDLTNSMLVYEGDAQLKSVNLLGIKTSLGAEAARSVLNPNLNKYALIDNMEGVKQEDSPAMDKNFWFIAANPPGSGPADPLALDWYNENVKATDINPAATSNGTQQVLDFKYDFSKSPEVSIVYPLSDTGLDFSQKTQLEMVAYGNYSASNPGPMLNLHLGQIDEDADNTGGQNFVCASGLSLVGAPKSEDLNCDGQLSPSEDIGWLYAPAGMNSKRYGANNGRLDSEDLNHNGRLDPQDFTGGDFGFVNGSLFTYTDTVNKATYQTDQFDFTGWQTLYVPLAISSTDTYKWNAIKQVRITLEKPPGLACSSSSDPGCSGVVKFAKISAVGNTWSVQADTNTGAGVGTIQVRGVNNEDNPGYVPIYDAGGVATVVYNDLYGSVTQQKQQNNTSNITEQTLALDYSDIVSTSAVYVYRKFTTPIDISQHKQVRFLLNSISGLDKGASFYILAGDQNNYFKAMVPLDFTGWKLVTIDQVDLTGDNIPDLWEPEPGSGVVVTSSGTPSLQQVPQFIVGVEANDGKVHSGTVYFDELYVAQPITRVGNADKVEGSFEIPGWLNFGAKDRFVDRSFQTPVTAITNQDNEQQTGYLNITRMAVFPINVTAARQITNTPNTLITGSNNLVSSLQQGKVTTFNGTAAGTLSVPALPKLGFNYTEGRTKYDLMSRKDAQDTYAATLNYAVPGTFPLFPRTLDLNYSFGFNKVNYDASKLVLLTDMYDTNDQTNSYGARLSFVPWSGSTFNPGYTLQTVSEDRAPLSDPLSTEHFNKSMQETANLNSNILIAKWLNPNINYSATVIESNNLTPATVTVAQSSQVFTAGQIKTVNRTAQGGVSLTLNMNDLTPNSRLLRSMVLSSNYQLQDGDSWNNVEDNYDTRSKLWVRTPLHPHNPFAQLASLTLRDTVNSTQRWQPLEGFDIKGAASPLKTLSITNNFTNSIQRSEVTGTISRTVNKTFPDMILSLSQLETLLRAERWAQGATVNLKYTRNTNENAGISLVTSGSYGMDMRFKLLNKVDTAFSYNLRLSDNKDLRVDQLTQQTRHDDATLQGTFDRQKFRFTPKIDYVSDVTKGALGVTTANTRTVTPSLLIKSDFTLPKGLKLPFTKNVIIFTNRIVWTTTLSYAIKSSPVTIADNNSLFSLNSSADYEAAKNLRLTFNLGLQRQWDKYLKEEDFMAYQAGTTVTFQF